ncbi:DUF1146 domain-containing protein [Paenibacillus beijingensis]|uniref:Membrane protein n=1 Tax=Paenibacillus beijingensis TaxID=1126833 RepID=A0A0D5NGM9_9BACL|nr:DUF1146 domain-containing protein [Paenibacillus beijingensis]AJY74554.1 membrane protein [Paenibacillus beijingensis]
MNTDRIWTAAGLNGLFSIIIVIISILLAWYVLQEVKLETFVRNPKSPKARILLLLVAVVLGHLFAGFILDYWGWTSTLKLLAE